MPWTETIATFLTQTAHHPTPLPDLASSCCCSYLLLCWQRTYCTLKAFLFSVFHGRMHFCIKIMVFILLSSIAYVWWMIKLCKCSAACFGFDMKLQFACKNCSYFCVFNYICDVKRESCKCLSTCFADQKLVENSFCTWKRGCKIYLKGDKFLGYLNRHFWTSAIWSFHITNCCNSFFKNILQRFPRVALFKKVTCQVQFRYWILRKTKQGSKQSFHHPNPQVNFHFS